MKRVLLQKMKEVILVFPVHPKHFLFYQEEEVSSVQVKMQAELPAYLQIMMIVDSLTP
jgi:hypothetical protein